VLFNTWASGSNTIYLLQAVTRLLALEKKARLAGDIKSVVEVAVVIVKLCKQYDNWTELNANIQLLCKRRQQFKQVQEKVIQQAAEYVDDTPDETRRLELITTLRAVSEGMYGVRRRTLTRGRSAIVRCARIGIQCPGVDVIDVFVVARKEQMQCPQSNHLACVCVSVCLPGNHTSCSRVHFGGNAVPPLIIQLVCVCVCLRGNHISLSTPHFIVVQNGQMQRAVPIRAYSILLYICLSLCVCICVYLAMAHHSHVCIISVAMQTYVYILHCTLCPSLAQGKSLWRLSARV
jgi:hypothetical protein